MVLRASQSVAVFLQFVAAFIVGCFLLCGAGSLEAQNISTAQLAGAVRDPQGAVIPGATVTIADPSRGFRSGGKLSAAGAAAG
jgi:hypothetical protein